MSKVLLFLIIVICIELPSGCSDVNKDTVLVGWGIEEKNLDKFIADAEAIGFDALITWSSDPIFLKKAVETGKKNNIKIFSSIVPMEELGKQWSNQYPASPVPWQIMSANEEASRTFIMAGQNQYLIPYQFGGEPYLTDEVLTNRIICFNNRECRDFFKPIIDRIISVPGIEGLAFDGFGYQNYYGCNCDHCQRLLTEYRKQYPEISTDEVDATFFRETLVDYINYLANYARSKKRDIKTTIHVWPVFAPDPLYGNRLNVDYCGQTAAWYTIWPKEKIAKYSRIISGESKKYHIRQQGVGMIGYYDRPGQFPLKDANRVDMELKTMIENGCLHIQVCGAKDVIYNKEISTIFKKYFK